MALVPKQIVSLEAPSKPEVSRNWQSPLLRGERLEQWSASVAEIATTMKLLQGRHDRTACELATEVSSGASYAMDQSPQRGCRECVKGCSGGCCFSMIAVTAPQVLTIADYVQQNLPFEEVATIRHRASQGTKETADLDLKQYAQAKVKCPLLRDDNSCAVYPVRPLRCRGWCSLSLDRCEQCTQNRTETTVPLDAHAYYVARGADRGMSQGIKAVGLDGDFYVLNDALATAMETTQGAERWANGEKVFSECRKYPVGV